MIIESKTNPLQICIHDFFSIIPEHSELERIHPLDEEGRMNAATRAVRVRVDSAGTENKRGVTNDDFNESICENNA